MSMPFDDLLGWMASLLTLITFAQTNMVPLRVTAILANVFFIAYGARGHFLPVLTLHSVLLPLNSLRLAGQIASSRTQSARAALVAQSPPSTRNDAFPKSP